LALNALLTLDAGGAFGPLDHALTLDARGAFGALNYTLLALDALSAFDSRCAFGTLNSCPLNSGSTLRSLNLLALGARSALALHPLRTLLCSFGPLGAIATVGALTLSTGGGRDCQRGDAGSQNHLGEHDKSPLRTASTVAETRRSHRLSGMVGILSHQDEPQMSFLFRSLCARMSR
jgi:hypothetical protein